MKKIIPTFFITVLFFPALIMAGDSGTETKLPAIACLYKTISHNQNSDHHDAQEDSVSNWNLWRTKQLVEIQDSNSLQGEIWKRLKGNSVEYSWLDHKRKFRVNYPPSDLKASNSNQLWDSKAHLISPTLLTQLKKSVSPDALGHHAEKYQGRVGNYNLEIIWIPELSIPARIVQKIGTEITTTELIKIYPYSKSPWKQIVSEEYDDMDFADIGDNEAHPIARSHLYGMGILAGEHKH